MTIRSVYQAALNHLGVGAVDTFSIHQLFIHHMQRTSVDDLLTHLDDPCVNVTALERDLERLKLGEPVAYILGKTSFDRLTLLVNPNVLIPRPETEELVHLALASFPKDKVIRAADIGTGSGAIALALKSHRRHWQVVGTDISSAALQVAKQNAINLNLPIAFVEGNGLEALKQQSLPTFELIISNPPYVEDEKMLDPFVQQFEPTLALIAKPASKYYALYLQQAKTWLAPHGVIAFEIDPSLPEVLSQLQQTLYPQATLRIHQDINRKARFAFLYT